jgi:hypothetical protein
MTSIVYEGSVGLLADSLWWRFRRLGRLTARLSRRVCAAVREDVEPVQGIADHVGHEDARPQHRG